MVGVSPHGGARSKYSQRRVLSALMITAFMHRLCEWCRNFGSTRLVALAQGTAFTQLFNFLWSQTFVFRTRDP